MNPLIQAIKNNNLHEVKLLIDMGSYVNIEDEIRNSLLHFTIESESSIDLIRLLIANGADVNAKDNDGETPLF